MPEVEKGLAEVRVISVAAIKAAVGALALISVCFAVMYFIAFPGSGGPMSDMEPARAVLYGFGFAGTMAAGQVWGLAVRRSKPVRRRDAVGLGVLIPAYGVGMTALMASVGSDPWTAPILVCGGVIAAWMVACIGSWWRDQRIQHAGVISPIAEPVVHRRIVGVGGTVDVRVGLPEYGDHGWQTRWSVMGAPSGDARDVAYGTDSMSSMLLALAMAGDRAGDSAGLLQSVQSGPGTWTAAVSLPREQ